MRKIYIDVHLVYAEITYSDSNFSKACPCRDLLSRRHVRVAVSHERALELLKLLRRKMRTLTSGTSLSFGVIAVI